MSEIDRRFHETWLGMVQPVDGLVVSIPVLVDGQCMERQAPHVQAKLVEDTLQAHPDISYVVGTAVTAEAAIPILRDRGVDDKIKILSYYYTPGVDQGIRRGQILAAPTDSPVIQGRIAIDQAVRILEGKDYIKHAGPALKVVSQDDVKTFDSSSTLAPEGFTPIFRVE